MAYLGGMVPAAHFTVPQRTLRGIGQYDIGQDPYFFPDQGGYSAVPPGSMDSLSEWLAAPNAILPMVSNLAFAAGGAILIFYLANKDGGGHGRRR